MSVVDNLTKDSKTYKFDNPYSRLLVELSEFISLIKILVTANIIHAFDFVKKEELKDCILQLTDPKKDLFLKITVDEKNKDVLDASITLLKSVLTPRQPGNPTDHTEIGNIPIDAEMFNANNPYEITVRAELPYATYFTECKGRKFFHYSPERDNVVTNERSYLVGEIQDSEIKLLKANALPLETFFRNSFPLYLIEDKVVSVTEDIGISMKTSAYIVTDINKLPDGLMPKLDTYIYTNDEARRREQVTTMNDRLIEILKQGELQGNT